MWSWTWTNFQWFDPFKNRNNQLRGEYVKVMLSLFRILIPLVLLKMYCLVCFSGKMLVCSHKCMGPEISSNSCHRMIGQLANLTILSRILLSLHLWIVTIQLTLKLKIVFFTVFWHNSTLTFFSLHDLALEVQWESSEPKVTILLT